MNVSVKPTGDALAPTTKSVDSWLFQQWETFGNTGIAHITPVKRAKFVTSGHDAFISPETVGAVANGDMDHPHISQSQAQLAERKFG